MTLLMGNKNSNFLWKHWTIFFWRLKSSLCEIETCFQDDFFSRLFSFCWTLDEMLRSFCRLIPTFKVQWKEKWTNFKRRLGSSKKRWICLQGKFESLQFSRRKHPQPLREKKSSKKTNWGFRALKWDQMNRYIWFLFCKITSIINRFTFVFTQILILILTGISVKKPKLEISCSRWSFIGLALKICPLDPLSAPSLRRSRTDETESERPKKKKRKKKKKKLVSRKIRDEHATSPRLSSLSSGQGSTTSTRSKFDRCFERLIFSRSAVSHPDLHGSVYHDLDAVEATGGRAYAHAHMSRRVSGSWTLARLLDICARACVRARVCAGRTRAS